jgi:hypothetical protein
VIHLTNGGFIILYVQCFNVFKTLYFYFQLTFFFAVSSFAKGQQMVPVLNECGTHCAVFGNHDFGKIAGPLFKRSLVCMLYMYNCSIFLLGPFINVNR